jgi:peptidoglycan/xylan/chitin deacetylase (PgdA/CDA1 family)
VVPTVAPPSAPYAARPQLDGRAFPDKVLALTWDDGPDANTLALARYLHSEHVSATFFVVGGWIAGLSDEPGQGRHVFETGYEHLPILVELVALGHRLGNHTRNHVILSDASAAVVASQLREDQEAIDRHQTAGLRLFRAPGGAWNAAASAVVDGDPTLSRLVGPVRWDIDGKDWEGSLRCDPAKHPHACEPAGPGGASRVKPVFMAGRYFAAIVEAGHGIVLLHDRVGDVGSDYALHVARTLVPMLLATGYTFAAPVLRFSPLVARSFAAGATRAPEGSGAAALGDVDPASIRYGDINGDGRADVCGRSHEGLVCALSGGPSFLAPSLWLAEMSDAAGWQPYGATLALVDVNGDGRADVCGRGPQGAVCGLSP